MDRAAEGLLGVVDDSTPIDGTEWWLTTEPQLQPAGDSAPPDCLESSDV